MTATKTAPFYSGGCTPIKCDVPEIRGVRSYKSNKRSSGCPTGIRAANFHETCTIDAYPGFDCTSPGRCNPGRFQNTARCTERNCPRLAIRAMGKTAGTVGTCNAAPASVLSWRATCTFKCLPGYDMKGKGAELTCGPSGKWGYEAQAGQ